MAISSPGPQVREDGAPNPRSDFSRLLTEELLYQVNKPGQYLGNEWGCARRDFDAAAVRLCLSFPDVYELGMSNFGLRILYKIVNSHPEFMCDRTYAPASDLELLLRQHKLPLWGFESRRAVSEFELLGFSLQYELCYTNVLNMLDMSGIPVLASERQSLFPLIFAGGPSCVNPEPMAPFMDFFIIGDGEQAVPQAMEVVQAFRRDHAGTTDGAKLMLLTELARQVPGVYVPCLYDQSIPPKPTVKGIPERVPRQVQPLNDDNQPSAGLIPYLATVHDRQVLEPRRGCDRGCRFCQPGYTFLPVRERSADDLVRISKDALSKSGYDEYSLLSLCVSDYTSLHEAVRALNREHSGQRSSMSLPSQRADRMNFDLAQEIKAVRKSGITLAPEAGTERLRAVINKGLSHQQIIDAMVTAYRSGWSSVKLYYMIGLPTETDADLQGIVDTLKEATKLCHQIRAEDRENHKAFMEFTCTISSFVPKPFTPFQWFGQCPPQEFTRKQATLRSMLKASGLRNVQLNCTKTPTSLLEGVISRGDKRTGELIHRAWRNGCTFDAWEDRMQFQLWEKSAQELGMDLEALACTDRQVGSAQPWDVVNVGLADWWLVNEWKKALAVKETAPCSENTCHACGVCTDLDTKHVLANPSEVVLGKNPFVQKLLQTQAPKQDDHPSLPAPVAPIEPPQQTVQRLIFEFRKTGELKFIGHLDLQHLFVRAARRAAITVAYTEGFNPGPKLSLALSLALYNEGLAELAELELSEKISAEDFVRRMNAQLPPEVSIGRARLAEKSKSSLSQRVGRATYRAMLVSGQMDAAGVKERVSKLLAAATLEVPVVPSAKSQRKNRHKPPAKDDSAPKMRDIKAGIYALSADENSPAVYMELAHGSTLHIKPSDVLKMIADEGRWLLTRVGLATADGVTLFDADEIAGEGNKPDSVRSIQLNA